MSPEPATSHKYAELSLDQIIGLFLAQLYGWLIRFHATGAPIAPHDIAQNVAKADALVHAFIRSRAAAQLELAGYTFAADAMREPIWKRSEIRRSDQGGAGSDISGYSPQTPAELLEYLETILSNFQRAEAIGCALARMVVYTLAVLTPEMRSSDVWLRKFTDLERLETVSAARPLEPWPPPFPPIPVKTGIHTSGSSRAEISEAWTPAFAGVCGG